MSKDAMFFGRKVAPQYFACKSGPLHRVMLADINGKVGRDRILDLEVPRGMAKTLLASTINPLHRAIFSKYTFAPVKYVVIASFSQVKANQIIMDYTNIINGDSFQALFPGTVLERETQNEIIVANKRLGFRFMVMARGRSSQMTGLRFEESRPQIFICDDLENPEESYNQTIVDDNEKFVNEVIQYSLDPMYGQTILIGTPFSTDCTTQRFAKYPRGVRVIRYPALVDDHMVPGMSAKLGVPEGHSIWEDRFPTAFLLQQKDDAIQNGTIDCWMRQMMLDPRSAGAVRIPLEKIQRVNRAQLFTAAGDSNVPLNVFILADYAYSRNVWADESAIVVWGLDNDGNYYLLHSDKGRWGDIGTTDRIIDQVTIYKKNLRTVGVESRGMGFIESRLLSVKKNKNLAFGVVELKPRNRAKSERIKAMISLFDDERIIEVGQHPKLEAEWARFRGEELKHGDDLADAASYILDSEVGYAPRAIETPENKLAKANHAAFEQWASSYQPYQDKGGGRVNASARYADADW